MRHSLHSHILYLEQTIQQHLDRLTAARLGSDERESIQMQLVMAERALARYREAYELELSVAAPDDPEQPENISDSGPNPHPSSPDKKKGGMASVLPRTRSRRRIPKPRPRPRHRTHAAA